MVFVLSHASIRQDEGSGGNALRTVSSTDSEHAFDASMKAADNAKEQEKKLNEDDHAAVIRLDSTLPEEDVSAFHAGRTLVWKRFAHISPSVYARVSYS